MTGDRGRDEIAEQIKRKYELIEDAATSDGVLAYGGRPPVRSSVNQTFLLNTLRAVRSENRSLDEAQRLRSSSLQHQRKHDRDRPQYCRDDKDDHDGLEGAGEGSGATEQGAGDTQKARLHEEAKHSERHARHEEFEFDVELQQRLSQHARRGRGGVGSRVFDHGPHVPDQPTASTRPEGVSMDVKNDGTSRDALISIEGKSSFCAGNFPRPQRAESRNLTRGEKVTRKVAKLAAEFMAQGVPQELAVARAELQQMTKKTLNAKQKKEKRKT